VVRFARGKIERAGDEERSGDGTGRFDFGAIYGVGASLGYTPREVDAMTLAELDACVDGWKRTHGSQSVDPPTDEETAQMLKEHGFA
jgi:hypothetical protein